MSNHTYQITEVVGSSSDGTDQAIKNALERVAQTVRNLEWFEMVSTRGVIDDSGQVEHFQVTLRVGFKVEDAS
ncbi:dodecin [Gulosibacter molinativorax]|uniref:Dodecin family protein n=1 Tax=Gulosibacter molinativorax TaxID=256821 RepID=A0ABT7C685_9MICO|nr:dodecin [Gulosibacter molinativorax]MDJ1370545.1 dodecin family protein [Gulosibacter molinativorax]QUY62042.1 Hypotetical protein [Gulosibacter molinativorax]